MNSSSTASPARARLTGRRRLLRLLLSAPAAVAIGCSRDPEPRAARPISVTVLPDQAPARLRARYLPLLDRLTARSGLEFRLVLADDYADMLGRFAAGGVDLALFGGVTFVKARLESRAVALVMRDIDLRFRSVFLAAATLEARTIEDLGGRRFGFGSELSTSGHYMPRYYLDRRGIDPESFFGEVHYTGAHDRTAAWIRDGKLDAGVANADIIQAMYADRRLLESEVRIVRETPPYADYVWAVQPTLPTGTRIALRDAFLALSLEDEAEREVLAALGAQYFVPALANDFAALERIVQKMMPPGTAP